MNCAACGHDNPERAKFCLECGAPFAARCGSCGVELPPAAKFCLECGTRIGAAPSAPARAAEAPGARTVVSIVFADLVGSTALHERLDAESVRQFMERYYAAMRGAVEAHGGRVTQVMGDGVKAVFGAPRVAEDDAIRAVRAGVEMQRSFRELADEQRGRVGKTGLRVAVNTGEVVSDGESEIIGDPVNVAARLQEQGKDGDVVIGGATQRIVGSLVTLDRLGSFALKGRAEQVEAYRVVSLEPPAATKAAFVGRDEELARLSRVYETTVAKPAAQLAVLLGSPGLGKSRLIEEFVRRLGDSATLLLAHCDAAGGATFAPLVATLRTHLGVDEGAKPEALRAAIEALLPTDDPERVRIAGGVAALLAGSPASPEETFFVVRRLLAALARKQPVVLVIDDLHWAESLLLDLVEHLVQWGSGVPLFVLIGARPELRELRSSLVVPGGFVADVLTLSGLDAGAAMRLAAGVIGAADLPAALAGRLLATSEGNPLFVGELVKMLVQEGVLHREGERWVASAALADLEMPPTIHALLAARIERLRPEERAVLERAAVVGRHFSKSAVSALLSQTSDLDARLEALRRSELIERDTGWFLGEPVLRFHHVLIRDAAYRRVLKGTRAELHARLAGWIEAKVGDAAEHDETIGWHLEQAHQHLAELGPLDGNGVELGARAARRLAAAGRRALARDDVALAASLLARALACLPAQAEERADLALDGCEALLSAGDVANAAGAIDELGRLSEASPRLRAWHTCFVGQLATLTSPQGLRATADAVSEAAAALAALGDAAGEAKAHFVNAQALARLGKVGACEAALDLALAAARRAGDRRRANAVLAGAPRAALWGPSPVTRASGRCLDVVRVLRITQGAPAVEAVALSCQGVLEALRGRTDAAKRMIASARKLVEELGIAQRLFETDVFAGRVALLEGDASGAERSLRGAYEGLRDLGLGIDAAQAAALLARALLAQGRAAEAEALSHDSEALAGDDLQAAIAWRGARAEALAQRGEHDEGVRLAQAAVEIAAATDALLDHADARVALAAALRAAARSAEADAEARRARELWETKGATLLAERAAREGTRAVSPAAAVAAPPTRRRRVRPNAVTENSARLDAAVAARDDDALLGLFADDLRVLEHTTGASFDRSGGIASYRTLLAARDPASHHEPLATLGESLALFRLRLSASGSRGRSMDVGAYEKEEIHSVETDGQGRRRAGEVWSLNHLGDAVARLYERYAELLPEGPDRTRAEAIARSIAAMASQPDATLRAAVFAPDIEVVDHRTLGTWSARGAESALRHFESVFEMSDAPMLRDHDVLALAPDALLTLRAHTGVGKQSGGEYERRFLNLLVAGADGRLARIEWFDTDREAAALARFDALTAASPPPVRRRVRPNAATDNSARLDAAIAARDPAAFPALVADPLLVVDHTTGAEFGGEAAVAAWRALIGAREPTSQHEPLATLGTSLALLRARFSASGVSGRRWDVGAYDKDEIHLVEADGRGRRCGGEVWSPDHLGDAIARLYERHAELLPEGPARDGAAATARSVAAMLTASVGQGFEASIAPGFEAVDHRLVGHESVPADALQRGFDARSELEDERRFRIDDVLALSSHALLRRTTHSGIVRASGGPFERTVLALTVFRADGRVTRHETFDAGQEDAALARFAALTGDAREAPAPVRRRVPDTAATRAAARVDAASAANDPAALAALYAEQVEVLHHPSGVSYGLSEVLKLIRNLSRRASATFTGEPLAALGESLALVRRCISHQGVEARVGSIGPVESDTVAVVELDERGLVSRSEGFASERLGRALVRLYERYAERLPAGPERERAAGMAQAVAALSGPLVLERWVAAYAPDIEQVDHRTLGSWSAQGAAEALAHVRALQELAADADLRVDDVLAATPSAVLSRRTHVGTSVQSGGRYERAFLALQVGGADGRTVRLEFFDPDREADALARFDALTATGEPRAPLRRVRENLATRGFARGEAAFAARDAEALAQLFDASLVVVHHPSGAEYGRREMLGTWRSAMRATRFEFRQELLASLGETLALDRHVTTVEGLSEASMAGFGLSEFHEVSLLEVDADGRWLRSEIFAADRLGDAIARLYARYAEQLPAGRERARAEATARTVAGQAFTLDLDRMAAGIAPEVDVIDHRRVGFGRLRGAGALVEAVRAMLELSETVEWRLDDLLGSRPDALLARSSARGVERIGGGAHEVLFLELWVFGEDGKLVRYERFDPEQEAEAFARFDALRAGDAAPRGFENAAARTDERLMAAFNACDWPGVLACVAPRLVFDERRRMTRNTAEREVWLEQFRLMFDQPRSRFTIRLLATRGERLSLHRHEFEAEVAGGGGPLEMEPHFALHEVDGEGRIVAIVLFDLADEAAAYAELDARFGAGEGAAHPRELASLRAAQRALVARDWNAFAALMSPDFVQRDHRMLVWASEGRDLAGFLAMVRSLPDLAPDATFHTDHLRLCERSSLTQLTQRGTRDGGSFESVLVAVHEFDAEGRILRWDTYDPDPPSAALARYEEIRSGAAPSGARFENAATRAAVRMAGYWRARDWEGYAGCLAPSLHYSDRRPLAQLELDRARYVEFIRQLGDMEQARLAFEPLATRGERLLLARLQAEVAGGDVGADDLELLCIYETDEHGAVVALVHFEGAALGAAYAELDARFAAGEGAAHPQASRWVAEFRRAFASRDWDAMDALQAPDQVAENHRLVGWGTLRGAGAWTRTLQELVALSPDVQQRVDHLRVSEMGSLWQFAWHGTRDGGPFEAPILLVAELDEGGRQRRLDVWEPDMLEAARARFADLAARAVEGRSAPGPFANFATRAVLRGAARIAARDWEGFRALFAPAFRLVDRTAIGKFETGRDEWLAAFREQVEMTSGPLVPHILATRGERLALVRMLWRGAGGDVGESELDWLVAIEVDERGDHIGLVSFEPSDLAGAVRELDARFAAGEGAASGAFAAVERVYAAVYRRDRGTLLAQLAPGFRVDDHRRLGFGRMLEDGEWLFRANYTLIELAPDFRYRVDHFAVRGRAFLTQVAQVGTREGGPFESPFLSAGAVDESGRLTGFDVYDVEEIEAARTRFEALAAAASAEEPFANAAMRAGDRTIAAWQAHDWEGFARLPEGFRLSDRRRAVQLELDRDATLEFSRLLVEGRSGRIRSETLATRGERLALARWRVEIVGGDVGESEIRHLNLFEVDERGAPRRLVRWDDDALEAAFTELEARFASNDRSAGAVWLRAFGSALARRDWNAMAALYAPDFVGSDHRLVSWGTLRGPVAFLETVRQMVALAPDVRLRVDHVRTHPRGVISEVCWVGTREGGAFESAFVSAVELAPDGRALRNDFYDPQHLPRALARFEEIRAGERSDPAALLAKPTLASAALERWWAALDVGAATDDWEPLRSVCEPVVAFEDRQRFSQVAGDLELAIESLRARVTFGARIQGSLAGTVGDRVAIARAFWSGGPGDARFEFEYFPVVEVAASGRICAITLFEDARDAQREAWARWAALDPVAAPWIALLNEHTDAWNAHDAGRVRSTFADEFVVEDHRFAGIGRIESADAYVDSFSALWDLAPDQRVEFSRCCAISPHAALLVLRRSGTLDGGGAFENEYAWLGVARGGRLTRLELFEIEDLDAALARFEALRPDPLAVPPNAASRAVDAQWAYWQAEDWAALGALFAGGTYEDRRRLFQLNASLHLADLRHLRNTGLAPARRLLAAAGDRLALEHMLWSVREEGATSEIELLHVTEVGADGRIAAIVLFDAGERAAASDEMFERWARQSDCWLPRGSIEFIRAWNRHDRAGIEAALPADYVFHDRRRTGIGRVEGAGPYADSVAALWKLSSDVRIDFYYVVAREPHGFVGVGRWFGTNAEGGEFEALFLGVSETRGEQQVAVDLFEVEEMDAALARLAELAGADTE